MHGRAGFSVMFGSPMPQFQQSGYQVFPFFSKFIDDIACIRWVGSSRNDPGCRKGFQAVGENVRGDFLRRRQKVPKVSLARKGEIPDDEQCPFVPENVEYVADWTGGASKTILFGHAERLRDISCTMQVIWYDYLLFATTHSVAEPQ